jgi:hypothetical protein
MPSRVPRIIEAIVVSTKSDTNGRTSQVTGRKE